MGCSDRYYEVAQGLEHAVVVLHLIQQLSRDARFAVRALGTTPAATNVALLSLAVTIGTNTAIFSILNGILLRPLPVEDPASLVHVTDSVRRETGETRIRAWSYPFWTQIRGVARDSSNARPSRRIHPVRAPA